MSAPGTPIRHTPAAVGLGAYGRPSTKNLKLVEQYLASTARNEAVILAFDGGRVSAKGLPVSRWNWRPKVVITTAAWRVFDAKATTELLSGPLDDIVWANTTSDGFQADLTRGRSLRFFTSSRGAQQMVHTFLAAVAEAWIAQAGYPLLVPAQRPVLLQGVHHGGYGTHLAAEAAVIVAITGHGLCVMQRTGAPLLRPLAELRGVQLGGQGEYQTGGGWFGGGFGVAGALKGAAFASVMNWLTTRTHMDTVLRLVFDDAEATLAVETHAPGRLELEMSATLAALRGKAVPPATGVLAVHDVAMRPSASHPPVDRPRFCGDCGAKRGGEAAFCTACGTRFVL